MKAWATFVTWNKQCYLSVFREDTQEGSPDPLLKAWSQLQKTPFSQNPFPTPEWHLELIKNSHLTWKPKSLCTNVSDRKGQEWVQESEEEQATEGQPIHDDGERSCWPSALENFRLPPHWGIARFIYHPVTSNVPSKKIKWIYWLGRLKGNHFALM